MTRRWRGPIVLEDTQTGDGRVIAEGAVYWAEPPLPFAWIKDGDQHVMPGDAPQIGTVETITRAGKEIIGEGTIDDESEDGAELCRKMDAGEAAGGSRQFVSIDADDWEVEVVSTTRMDDVDVEVEILASAPEFRGEWPVCWVSGEDGKPRPYIAGKLNEVGAAAGDPDPGPGGGPEGESLFENAADEILERATRLRIRGVTACAVSAFDGAYIELVDGAAQVTANTEPADGDVGSAQAAVRDAQERLVAAEAALHAARTPEEEPVTIRAHAADLRQPPEFFEDPKLTELQRWTTITPEGRVYGHLAGHEECHIGILDRCVTTADIIGGGYDYAHPGHVLLTDGTKIGTGPLAIKGGHAHTAWNWRQAQAHYDDPEAVVADVRYGTDEFGIWFSGALRPTASEEQIYALRASGVSLDARMIGGQIRLIASCCVNVPGFPKVRARLASGELVAVVAAGGPPQRDPDLQEEEEEPGMMDPDQAIADASSAHEEEGGHVADALGALTADEPDVESAVEALGNAQSAHAACAELLAAASAALEGGDEEETQASAGCGCADHDALVASLLRRIERIEGVSAEAIFASLDGRIGPIVVNEAPDPKATAAAVSRRLRAV